MTFNSVRHSIMQQLKELLKTMTKANGYETDIKANAVREWEPAAIDFQSQTIAPIDSDYINIQDTQDAVDETTIQQDEHILTVDIEFYGTGFNAHLKMRKFAADLITFVGNNRGAISGIQDMELSGTDSAQMFQNQKRIIVYKTELDIIYTTNTNEAYH